MWCRAQIACFDIFDKVLCQFYHLEWRYRVQETNILHFDYYICSKATILQFSICIVNILCSMSCNAALTRLRVRHLCSSYFYLGHTMLFKSLWLWILELRSSTSWPWSCTYTGLTIVKHSWTCSLRHLSDISELVETRAVKVGVTGPMPHKPILM